MSLLLKENFRIIEQLIANNDTVTEGKTQNFYKKFKTEDNFLIISFLKFTYYFLKN